MKPNLPLALSLAFLAAACSPVEKQATLATPSVGTARSAGPGDTVLEFDLKKPLPNAFGKADLFGRTTYAGRTSVRFLGSEGSVAVFERSDLNVESDATTMSQTPLIIPQTSSTSMTGMVGHMPVSGTAESTSYSVVGPRPSRPYASAAQPLVIRLAAGQSVPIEGHTLSVIKVGAASVQYRID